MSNKVVTIEDVALLAKTSPSTVSNVLNGRLDRMRPETQARIQRAMEQLGYTPNQLARQLKTGKTPILGLIVPSVANPFWGSFAQYVEEAARDRGYQVLLGNAGRDPAQEERYAESLWSYGIRGVIFGSSPLSLDYVQALVKRGMRAVTFDRDTTPMDRAAGGAIDSVSIENAKGARLATDHLLALGHRRIGFLSGPLRTASRLERLNGYRDALRAAGIAADEGLVWEGFPAHGFGDVEGAAFGRRGARELLEQPDPPTALFAINDMYALGAYAGARDVGARVPDDVSIVGFDDIAFAEIAQPPLTTIRQPLRDMLQATVAMLIDRLEGAKVGPADHLLAPPELIVRASTAPRAAKRGASARAAPKRIAGKRPEIARSEAP
ncbi:MAG TPA: LacI family DNA-binding transcriptional regulator [Thermomicrobiales bacterium]|nr:LacI family DNA-binding transcriptional regulator [Thermomicrobiales bacterium]